jgi:predicted phage tail protein
MRTLRKIKLYGSLAKDAGVDEFNFAFDTVPQLLAVLSSKNPSVAMALRTKEIGLAASDDNDANPRGHRTGFNFGVNDKVVHVAPMTEGNFVIIPFLIKAAVAIAISYLVTKLTMSHIKTGANGPGGRKSTVFNGPVNSTDQGGAIPVVCGKEFLVGSTIIAAAEEYVNIS